MRRTEIRLKGCQRIHLKCYFGILDRDPERVGAFVSPGRSRARRFPDGRWIAFVFLESTGHSADRKKKKSLQRKVTEVLSRLVRGLQTTSTALFWLKDRCIKKCFISARAQIFLFYVHKQCLCLSFKPTLPSMHRCTCFRYRF